MTPRARSRAVSSHAAPADAPAIAGAGVTGLQARTLLDRVRATAAEAIAAAEWDCDAQVEALRRGARTAAHAQVRAAARAKRERVAERCRKALAEAETRERTSAFELERGLLDRALAALPAALESRWQDAAARRRWCAAAAATAARSLVAAEWVASLAPAATDDDLAAVRDAASTREASVHFETDAALRAGLRLSAGGVTVDATPGGLLADRAIVESLLLAELSLRGAP